MAVVGAVSAAALLFVAGCGGDEGETEPTSQQEPKAQQNEDSTEDETSGEASGESEGETDDSGGAGESTGGDAPSEATEPGTALKVGEQAVLPVTKDGKDVLIGFTVTAIEKGDQKALRQQFGEQAEGITPYYVKYEVENIDGSDLSFVSSPNIGGTGAGGESTGAVVSGDLPDCESASAPADFAAAGDTYSGCSLEGSGGVEIVEANYEEGDYYDNPVVWKP